MKAAKAIVARQRQQAIRERNATIVEAELTVEAARQRIERANEAKVLNRFGGGASDTDVERFLIAKARLTELCEAPLPGVGEPVLDEDRGPQPVLLCETCKVEMRGTGVCPVCQGTRLHQPIRPALDRLKPFLARGHGIA